MTALAPEKMLQAIRDRAPDIARDIRSAADKHPGNETAFRMAVARIAQDFADEVGLKADPRHEYALFVGRPDSIYNRLIVEYKAPGNIRRTNVRGANRHAIEQVQGYIEALSREEICRKESIAGVVLDGHWFIFVRYRDDRWDTGEPVPVAEESTGRFLECLSALSLGRPVTPENLIRDFGENTHVSRACVSRMYAALCASSHPRVDVLFRQWSLQFKEICGYDPDSTKLAVKDLADKYGVAGEPIDPSLSHR